MIRILVILLTVLAFGALQSFAGEPVEIDAPQAQKQVAAGQLTLIDVRRPDEWAATGLPEGATGATLQDSDFVAQVLSAVNGDKHAPVALICRAGGRSTAAAAQLEAAGFTAVHNVKEGMLGRAGSGPGWLARELPVEQVE